MTKVTRLTLDEGGALKSRRILLREISEDTVEDEMVEEVASQTSHHATTYAPNTKPKRSGGVRRAVIVRNVRLARLYTNQLILALVPVISYDRSQHHNQPPPELWIDDDGYLRELRRLVAALKLLSESLELGRRNAERTEHSAVTFKEHLHTFLSSYSDTLGKSAAYATVGLAAAVLYETGFGKAVVHDMVSAVKIIK